MNKIIKKLLADEERTAGILLIVATCVCLLLVNLGFGDQYRSLRHIELGLTAGDWVLHKSLLHWVNDGLMTLFFLLVGLEIKHEIFDGALSDPSEAGMTVAAALGGMLVPAGVYLLIAADTEAQNGWGVPVATDIAFVVGLLGLLGSRVSTRVKVFITAIAVVDDIGAVLIIAVFYSGELLWNNLFYATGLVLLLYGYNKLGGRRVAVYALIGIVAWVFMLASGVHATLLGVMLAFVVPLDSNHEPADLVEDVESWKDDEDPKEQGVDKASAKLREIVDKAQSPRHRLETAIRHWVLFLVMPLFAFMNAGVEINTAIQWASPAILGITAGLVLGKPLGMLLFIWVAHILNLAKLPDDIPLAQLVGVCIMAGIGFTMALFISGLAFADDLLLDQAKIGILAASAVAAIAGILVLLFAGGTAEEK